MAQLDGKTVLVTGATDGVGRLVARELGANGARVLVHGRDRARGEAVVNDIEAAGGQAELLLADLASLAEVRRLADAVTATTDRLDILVNNAGLGSGANGGTRGESADGHELLFAVNYLAGYLLTRRLLPLLKAAAPSRIVMVSSLGQQAIDFDDVMLTRGYNGTRAYCQSKLAQIMFAFDLNQELAGTGVTANALHPATYMDTTMVRQAGREPWSSVDEGAEAILDAALAPAKAEGGRFFNGLAEARADRQAYDAEARARLRVLSERLTAG
jgi:NAD(P)-dependent dehydrogenase (short-subunit alcohol dehydrogenase family)